MPLEKSTDSETTNGKMGQYTMVIGRRTKYQASVLIPGSMDVNTRVNGLTTTWKASEFINGVMEEFTKVNTRTIKNMALVSTPVLIKKSMKATGTRENSMGSVLILLLKAIKSNLVCGKTVSV